MYIILKLSPHKVLITLKGERNNVMVEKPGRYPYSSDQATTISNGAKGTDVPPDVIESDHRVIPETFVPDTQPESNHGKASQ